MQSDSVRVGPEVVVWVAWDMVAPGQKERRSLQQLQGSVERAWLTVIHPSPMLFVSVDYKGA